MSDDAASRAERWAWRVLEHGPPGTERALALAQRYLGAWLRLRIPVVRLATPDGLASVVVAGDRPSIAYLVRHFAGDELRREPIATTPLIALPRVLARLERDADLVIARVERPAARWLFGRTHLRVPEAVGAELVLPQDPATRQRVGRSQGNNIRRIRAAGLAWTVSRSRADFDLFYRQMYLPFARRRFGEDAYLRNPQRLRRAFRRGFVLWVESGTQRLAGALFRRKGDVLYWVATGVADGDLDLAERGALSALYLFAVEAAQREGASRLDLGASRPSLRDGVLVHKKRWGGRLVARDDVHHDLCLRWRIFDERVARFLERAPLVFRDGDGLSALTALPSAGDATAERVRDLWRELRVPGLRRLVVVTEPMAGVPAVAAEDPPLWLAAPGAPLALLAAARR